MTKWEGKKIIVFGLGRSGLAIARKLIPLKAQVVISEKKALDDLAPSLAEEARGLGAKIEAGEHSDKCLEGADLIVLSPAVHPDIPILKKAKENNIPVISEIELAARFFHKPIIAVTGTNGKTTTVTLIGEFLKAAGKKAAVAGNIGIPLISIDNRDLDFIVAEISSYQLETIVTFRPWISLILNLTQDHIERHKNMEEYGKAKARVFLNQKKNDYLIYNAEDPLVCALIKGAEARLVPFYKKAAEVILGIPAEEVKIKGDHNLENAMAAALAAKITGVSPDIIARVLRTFAGVPHRIEFIRELAGVKYYNDSKATNPDSTMVALRALRSKGRNIVVILGGRDKNTDLSKMCELMKDSVKEAVLIGEAAGRFEKELKKSKFTSIARASDFKGAIARARSAAKKGDVVLLSPACASFDMFKDFEERGEKFKLLVNAL